MFQVSMCTCPDKSSAERIAVLLIEQKLAACINIIPQITSIYSWQNEIVKDEEYLLLIKSQTRVFDKMAEMIKQYHPYETPEIIALDIKQGDKNYLNWLTETMY